MAHDFTVDPSGNIVIASGFTLVQLAGGVHYEATSTNISGAVSTLDFGGKAVLLHTVTGDLSGSYTFPPLNMPSLTQNSTRTVLMIEYTQDATGGRAIPLNTLFANATRIVGLSGADCVDTAIGGKTRVRLVVKRIGGVTEVDAEFIPVHRHSNITVGTQHSLTGGGTLGANRTLALVGDTATPGNNKFYGTDGTGTRGWQGPITLDDLSDVTITAPATNQVIAYNGTTFVNAEPTGAGGTASEVVDTLAALQAIAAPTNGQIVDIRGYSAAFDGGNGRFIWNASAVENFMLSGATVNAGGTNYEVGDLVLISGGTPNAQDGAFVRVATVSGTAVATVSLVYNGSYVTTPGTTGIATTSAGGGSGCTLNLTWATWTNYGTQIPKATGGTGRWSRISDGSGRTNVKAFGAKGDGVTDDWLALQRAIWAHVQLFLPSGSFHVSAPLTWNAAKPVDIQGVAKYKWHMSRIRLTANTDEPLLHRFGMYMKHDGTYAFETGYSSPEGVQDKLILRDINLCSTSSIYGSCIETLLLTDSLFFNVRTDHSYRGITCAYATFDTSFMHICCAGIFMNNFPWNGTTNGESNKIIARRAWGLNLSSHGFVTGGVFTGNGTGIRTESIGNTLVGARIEVNNYGMILASSAYDRGSTILVTPSRSHFSGLSFEANTIGLRVETGKESTIENFAIQGSPESGARPEGEIGIHVIGAYSTLTIRNGSANGTFSKGAILNEARIALENVSGGGSVVSYAKNNSVFGNTGTNSPYYRLQSYETPNGNITAYSNLHLRSISALNVRDGFPRSKNLGDVVSPSTGATTASVTFPGLIQGSTYAFNTLTTPADGTSTLTTGTYYYGTTVLTKHGETGVNYNNSTQHNHRAVAVTSGQAVAMTFYGGTVSSMKRRIYRSKVNDPGYFEGYWEQSNTGSSFTDTGQSFTARAMPPPESNIPSCEESDTSYQIVATPSWNTTVWITNKTTTGFTLNFGTAAPASQTCAWLLYRP